MQWTYRHNPDKEYGVEIFPSKENYESLPVKHKDYRPKSKVNFGLMEIFVLVMVIPFWIFIYKFFYLLVLPLIPISVVVFEMIREVAPMNLLVMYGGSFFVAYLFYRGLKCLFTRFSFLGYFFLWISLYLLSVFGVYFLLGIYPNNIVLNEVNIYISKLIWL